MQEEDFENFKEGIKGYCLNQFGRNKDFIDSLISVNEKWIRWKYDRGLSYQTVGLFLLEVPFYD